MYLQVFLEKAADLNSMMEEEEEEEEAEELYFEGARDSASIFTNSV